MNWEELHDVLIAGRNFEVRLQITLSEKPVKQKQAEEKPTMESSDAEIAKRFAAAQMEKKKAEERTVTEPKVCPLFRMALLMSGKVAVYERGLAEACPEEFEEEFCIQRRCASWIKEGIVERCIMCSFGHIFDEIMTPRTPQCPECGHRP